jgi:pyruvate dehydrogenase E2 component (dihydrolipoamide acetyltransferase)
MIDFCMPSLGADMDDGVLLEWRIKPGDRVERGQIVAVVETMKGAIEIEVFHAGVVAELVVAEGEKLPVGAVLARLTGEGEAAPVQTSPPAPLPAPPPAPLPAPPPPPPPEPSGRSSILSPPPSREGWVRSSPSARVLAAELGVDLHEVVGTGPHGAVRRPDVEAHRRPATPTAPAPSGQAEAMRRAIAIAMSRSNREIPHYHLLQEIDLSAALTWLGRFNLDRPVAQRVLPAALLIRASALALARHPELNGTWRCTPEDPVGRFEPADGVHPGIAISLRGGGLVRPALLHADRLPLPELMAQLGDLVERARAGRLRSSELAQPTITLTNLGDTGSDAVLGLIYPPQVALLGFGRIAERPVAVDGLLGVHPTVLASLSADHRASDGHDGSRFLTRLDRLLQRPEKLL